MNAKHLFDVPGEMASRMRSIDWSATPLGPVSRWSQALRNTVGLLLHNKFPILLWWGPQFVQLYNDAYVPIPGDKHPGALGQTGPQCWSEIWHIIGPMAEAPFSGQPATTSDDLLLLINRKGFLEETHFKMAYSPVPDETVATTGIGGVIATVAETTEQVFGERQLRTLRELGARAAQPGARERLRHRGDDAGGESLRRALRAVLPLGTGGLAASGWSDRRASSIRTEPPSRRDRSRGRLGSRRVAARFRRSPPGDRHPTRHLGIAFPRSRSGRWSESPRMAIALPLAAPGQPHAYGVLVAGVSPRRALDDNYRGFFELVGGHVGTAIAQRARIRGGAQARRGALARLDRAKTAFFSNVSHEFRTPLTLMLGPLEDALGLAGRALARRASSRRVHRNALRLLKLVNTLLDFSRIEAGRMQATFEPTDLAALTARAGERLSARPSSGRGCARSSTARRCRSRSTSTARCGRRSSSTCCRTPSSSRSKARSRVTLRARRRHVELRVATPASGSPPRELPRIFERFHRIEGRKGAHPRRLGHRPRARARARQACTAATIRAASEPGEGTDVHRRPSRSASAHLPEERVGATRRVGPTATRRDAYVEEALRWLPAADASAPRMPPRPKPAERGRAASSSPTTTPTCASTSRGCSSRAGRSTRRGRRRRRWRPRDGSRPISSLTDVMMPRLDGFGLLAGASRRRRDSARCRSSCSRRARAKSRASKGSGRRRRLPRQAFFGARATHARRHSPGAAPPGHQARTGASGGCQPFP